MMCAESRHETIGTETCLVCAPLSSSRRVSGHRPVVSAVQTSAASRSAALCLLELRLDTMVRGIRLIALLGFAVFTHESLVNDRLGRLLSFAIKVCGVYLGEWGEYSAKIAQYSERIAIIVCSK